MPSTLWTQSTIDGLVALIDKKEFAQAERRIISLLSKDDKSYWGWMTLGYLKNIFNDQTAEKAALKKALTFRFDEKLARRYVDLEVAVKNYPAALLALDKILTEVSDKNLQLLKIQILARGDFNKRKEALKIIEGLFVTDQKSELLIEEWANILLFTLSKPETVIESAVKLFDGIKSTDAALYRSIARAYHKLEAPDDAIKNMKHAVNLSPNHAQWWYDLAVYCRQVGDNKEGLKALEKAVELDPKNPTYLRVYATDVTPKYGDELVSKINCALARVAQYDEKEKLELHIAAAKVYDQLGDPKCSFAHLEQTGNLAKKIWAFEASKKAEHLGRLRQTLRPELYSQAEQDSQTAGLFTFVLGMPRSGTSLVEQILSSHSKVYAAGELKLLNWSMHGLPIAGKKIKTINEVETLTPSIAGIPLNQDFLLALSDQNSRPDDFKIRAKLYSEVIENLLQRSAKKGCCRVIDKMPENYAWAGHIPLLFPDARIIHIRRHPIDNCLSMYQLFFADGMPWTYDLDSLVDVYRAYHEHMKFLEKTVPNTIMLSIRYEDLVKDPGKWSKAMIKHIGLAWEPNCLKFYETPRAVKTASLKQVRKPIYRTSLARWKKYEPFLQPLIKGLSDITKEYESI